MNLTRKDLNEVNRRVIQALEDGASLPLHLKAQLIEQERAQAAAELTAKRTSDTVRPPAR